MSYCGGAFHSDISVADFGAFSPTRALEKDGGGLPHVRFKALHRANSGGKQATVYDADAMFRLAFPHGA